MSLSGRLGALASVAVIGSLAACTSTSTSDGAPNEPDESASPSAATAPSGEAADRPVLRCQDADTSIVEMAKAALAPHPGPVRAATVVRAAKTQTGTWFVVGIDRAYATDDGTLTGGASRSLALTNAPAGVNFIPLGDGVTGKPITTSWDRVKWTGSRLAAGKRALGMAVGCLDATAGKS
jgi:hypothetical protein